MDTTQLLGTKKNETPPLRAGSLFIFFLWPLQQLRASFNALQNSCQQVHAYYSSSTLRI